MAMARGAVNVKVRVMVKVRSRMSMCLKMMVLLAKRLAITFSAIVPMAIKVIKLVIIPMLVLVLTLNYSMGI